MASPTFHTILSIPELLESILLRLSLSDLLHAQRVSHHFHSTILSSPALQQKLFFRPISPSTRSPHQSQPEFNPLLQTFFPSFFQLTEVPPRWYCNDTDEIQEQIQIEEQSWYRDEGRRKAVLRKDASWRRMFPIQPPARIEGVVTNGWCCCYEECERRGVISNKFQYLQEHGATMGLLYDVSVLLIDSHADGWFFVRWGMFLLLPREEEGDGVGSQVGGVVDREDCGKGRRTELRNEITIFELHNERCINDTITPSGLELVEFEKGFIKWG